MSKPAVSTSAFKITPSPNPLQSTSPLLVNQRMSCKTAQTILDWLNRQSLICLMTQPSFLLPHITSTCGQLLMRTNACQDCKSTHKGSRMQLPLLIQSSPIELIAASLVGPFLPNDTLKRQRKQYLLLQACDIYFVLFSTIQLSVCQKVFLIYIYITIILDTRTSS